MDFFDREYKLFKTGIWLVFKNLFYVFLALIFSLVIGYVFFRLTSIPGQSFQSWNFSITEVTRWFVAIYSLLLGFLLSVQVWIFRNVGFHLKKTGKTVGGIIPGLVSGVLGVACCSPAIVGIAALAGGGAIAFISANQLAFALPSIALVLLAGRYSLAGVAEPFCKL